MTVPSVPDPSCSSSVIFCYLCPCECGCGGHGEVPRPGSGGYHADVTKESLLEWIKHAAPSIISNSLPALPYRHDRRAYALELAVNHEDVRLASFLLEDFIEESAKRKAVIEACKKANLTLVWTLLQKMRADNELMVDCMLMMLRNGFDRGILKQLREDAGEEVYGRALGQFAAIPGSSDRIKEAVLEENLDAKYIPIKLALVGGELDLVQFLVDRGSPVDVKCLAESIRLVLCHIAQYFVGVLSVQMDEDCFIYGCQISLTHDKLDCLIHIVSGGMPPYAMKHLEHLFLEACRAGSVLVVTGIYEWLEDPNSLVQEGLALVCANPMESTDELIKILISYGATPNADEAFLSACRSGNLAAIKTLSGLATPSEDLMRRGIVCAAESGHRELLRWLILRLGPFEFLDDLLRRSIYAYEHSPDEEVRSKHRKVLLFLIDIGANVRVDNDHILVAAVKSFDFIVVSRALELGADPESNDHEALILATAMNIVWMAVYVADHGADLQARSNYCIKTAARLGSYAYFRFLSEKGGDMGAEGYECFRLAVENGHLNIVQLIWETADPKPETNKVLSDQVIRSAIESGDVELVSYLFNTCGLRIDHIPNILVSAVKSKSFQMYGIVRDGVSGSWKLPDKIAALEASIEYGCYDIFNRLLGYTCKVTEEHRLKLFMMAVQGGNCDMMRHLIAPITDPSPIMIALVESARLGHLEAIQFLLESNPFAFTKECLDDALRASISSHHICVIELLLCTQNVQMDPNSLALDAIRMDAPGIFVLACRIGADLKAVLKGVEEEDIGTLVGQAIQDIKDGFIRL